MTDRIDAMRALKEKASRRLQNARNAGKEGKGTHRNAGDSGRVAALWMEAANDVDRLSALIAQEEAGQ